MYRSPYREKIRVCVSPACRCRYVIEVTRRCRHRGCEGAVGGIEIEIVPDPTGHPLTCRDSRLVCGVINMILCPHVSCLGLSLQLLTTWSEGGHKPEHAPAEGPTYFELNVILYTATGSYTVMQEMTKIRTHPRETLAFLAHTTL